jgi:hypothetical protein
LNVVDAWAGVVFFVAWVGKQWGRCSSAGLELLGFKEVLSWFGSSL